MADYVLDASALARLFLDDSGADAFRTWYYTAQRDRVRFHAPSLIAYELANLLHRERGGTDAHEDPEYALGILRDVLQGVRLDEEAWTRTWRWAAQLTAYDAAYLGLAVAKGATLVTYDRKLAAAARGHVGTLRPDRGDQATQ